MSQPLISKGALLTPTLALEASNRQLAQSKADDVVGLLGTNIAIGLSSQVAWKRLEEFGANEIETQVKERWPAILFGQFQSSVVVLLLVASGISYACQEILQALGIMMAVLINASVGFFMELRAKTSLEALARLSGAVVRARRDGKEVELPVRELVPGDIVVLGQGSRIPADLRFVESASLSVDESAMTGESVPVWKTHEWIELENEYCTLGFQGTIVVSGRAVGVVTATGSASRLGQLGRLVATTASGETPLRRRLEVMGRQLSILTVVVCVAVTVIGIWQKHNVWIMLQTGIALAVAAVPEGLPVLATLALAIGTQRMVRAKALLRTLAAVETLGCTNVICSDKTGTLTENKMSVTDVVYGKRHVKVGGAGYELQGQFKELDKVIQINMEPELLDLLRAGALCNDASIRKEEGDLSVHGDPTEAALLVVAAKAGMNKDALAAEFRRIEEFPFEVKKKRMTTVHEKSDGKLFACIKGSPEALFVLARWWLSAEGKKEFSGQSLQWFEEQNAKLAGQGLRVLAVGMKELDDKLVCLDQKLIEKDITLLGLVGMCDRPKPGVREAIAQCHDAGIRVIMVTGDQKATARSIAEELQIISQEAPEGAVLSGDELETLSSQQLTRALGQTSVLARVTPEMKLSVVRSLQEQGAVVAMTGDGVNDAPALKQANIGVAMGKRGTDLAREVSEMIITDDNFASIVKAVEQGRIIYRNIQRSVGYLLTASISAVSTIAFGVIFNTGLPLTPLQLLWLNLIMHIFPGLGIVLQRADRGIMMQAPRGGQEELLGKHEHIQIWIRSVIVSLTVIGILQIHTKISGDAPCVTTVGLTGISMALLFQAWSWLEVNSQSKWRGMAVNWPMVINMGIAYGLLLSAIYLPGLQKILGTVPLTWT
ncbi:MAG: cation-translocating P-type ATPase, partial [Candidatus Melainabacteria bacterium]|nr:cation-translocating P-type ATPase [Candidatus Melainabacteria bacterium]